MSDFATVNDMPERHRDFTAQRFAFLEKAREQLPDDADLTVEALLRTPPRPLAPVVIDDPASLTDGEREAIAAQFWGPDAVAYAAVANYSKLLDGRHIVLTVAEQLSDDLGLRYPVEHPMEQHPEARGRFGEPDGTLKIYNLPIPDGVDKYREVAESKELFAAHNDGLGYGGAVAAVTFFLDSPPAWGGYTCFQNLLRIAIAIANDDPDGFEAMFLPDAITALRPRGKGAIRVTSPILYLNTVGEAQTFYRVSSGEYVITWRHDVAALNRVAPLLLQLAQPFAPASTFVHLMHPGEGVFIRNAAAIHSRTPFEDDVYGTSRVLARKWFVRSAGDATYKHVPGMNVAPEYAALFPEYFASELVEGEWHFDAASGENRRIG
jgi:hypothetical protein